MELTPQVIIKMQQGIEKIEGVHSSKIMLNEHHQIGECHILADSKRHPKQISKDVQSVLATKFEYRIDHRIISVAQISNEAAEKVIPRIVYKSVEINKHGQMMTAIVTCQLQDVQYEGKYEGVATKNGDFRVIAEATLEGVRCHVAENEHIVLEGYRVHEVGGIQLANVVLTFVRGETEAPLVGTAIVGDHPHESYVKAVFDALNRVLFVGQ